ncbi:MAG: methylmalonyl Co-A mutase-associated GTPase MeaB [Actinomycetes bacterium]
MRQALDPATLAEHVVAGSRAHVARALTLVESSRTDHRAKARELLTLLRPHTGNAVRVGISGVPGAGKSTFINAMGVRLIERGHRIAVLAVDPSSSRSGGSVLGDRTRMADLAESDRAFIRPSPSGNHLGGVARATREGMLIMEAAGFDTIWVETVGVGQSEVAVAGMVDTFLLLMIARTGDQLQGIKRGILEMADVIAVNKADGDGITEARVAARELKIAMRLIKAESHERRTPVLTSSSYTGEGLDEVWQAVLDHRAQLAADGRLDERRAEQQRDWMWALVMDDLTSALRRSPAVKAIAKDLEAAVGRGDVSAVDASQQILEAFKREL